MDRTQTHVMHSVLLGLVAYFIMVMLLKQPHAVAEKRSVILAAVAVIYMVMYGHSLPKM